MGALNNGQINFVDVREVARIHVRALERAIAANKRYVISLHESSPLVDVGTHVKNSLDRNGYQHNMVVKFDADSPTLRDSYSLNIKRYDSSLAARELGYE